MGTPVIRYGQLHGVDLDAFRIEVAFARDHCPILLKQLADLLNCKAVRESKRRQRAAKMKPTEKASVRRARREIGAEIAVEFWDEARELMPGKPALKGWVMNVEEHNTQGRTT